MHIIIWGTGKGNATFEMSFFFAIKRIFFSPDVTRFA